MRNYITETTFKELHISLPEGDTTSLLAHLNEELEKRVGAEITNTLDEQQLHELVKLRATASNESLNQWLRRNVADFDQILSDETDILLGELAEKVDAINNIA